MFMIMIDDDDDVDDDHYDASGDAVDNASV